MSKNVNDVSLANLKHYEGKWRNGATRTIRVPIALADATLEYTRQLDNSTKSADTSDLSNEVKPFKDETEALKQELAEVRAENQEWKKAFAMGDQTVAQAKEDADSEYRLWVREFTEMETERDNLAKVLAETKQQYFPLRGTLNQKWRELRSQLATVQAENEKLKASHPAAEFDLPEAAELLNRLKAKRKKSTASLADVEALLEMIEES